MTLTKALHRIVMVTVLTALAGCADFEIPDLRDSFGSGRAEPVSAGTAIPPAEEITATPLEGPSDPSIVNRGPCIIGAADGSGGTGCPQVE